jgi:hypothetical protein
VRSRSGAAQIRALANQGLAHACFWLGPALSEESIALRLGGSVEQGIALRLRGRDSIALRLRGICLFLFVH